MHIEKQKQMHDIRNSKKKEKKR